MAPKSWLRAIPQVKGKVRAVTPLPPEPKHEGEKKSMGFKLSFGNDVMADSCLGIGLVAAGILLSSIMGYIGEQWNNWQAQAYFADVAKDTIAGEHARESNETYKHGLFMANYLLYKSAPGRTLSQAKQ